MGCDIHMWAEVKKKYRNPEVKPQWEAVGRVFKNTYFSKKEVPTMFEDGYCFGEPLTDSPYAGRNYSLFSILANVRNGYGFAGVDTGDGFKPICKPKGVPKDASDFYKREVKEMDGDGHSHSYFNLDELKKYDWHGQITTRRGLVDPKEYKHWLKNRGRPRSWCGGATNKDYKSITWKETYYETVKDFVDKTIPRLEKLRKYPDVLDVRIVFFFDN